MSRKIDGQFPDAHDGVIDLFARAAAADARSHDRLEAAIDDLLTPHDNRLDDRTRAAIEAVLAGLVATVERELRQSAGRLLVSRGEPELALEMSQGTPPVLGRLVGAGLIRDADFSRELIARTRLDMLVEALPVTAPEGERPSLLASLATHPDRVVSAAAVVMLVAESRRKPDTVAPAATELPIALHRKLMWWVAAALREAHVEGPSAVLDRALADATQRSLSAYEDAERLEVAAMRLAAALDTPHQTLPGLLNDALADRRGALFVALLAHALELDFAVARDVVLDPAGDRLWLVLRALAVPREAIAHIGLALSDADPRRDLEAFADALDDIASIAPDRAEDALAALRLDPSFRTALVALARRPGR